ncbi:ricin-type beta-trefoil lectin domain protein [Streptomyces sp. bgisy032]|uniref:RICIN domain-containing protein n=1 Tax=Streptomyces sp. bgisy032 TaxID=3413773 RepID=UPI003D75DC5B
MRSPHPPRPPYPPRPGSAAAQSDRELLARAADPAEGSRAVAVLLARHWRPVHEYAVICLASSQDSASMAAAAAFRRELARPGGGALRPRLLAAVRDTAGEWAADDGISGLLPELRSTAGARGLRAAPPPPRENRRLADRAFRALPGASQCLLWHTEVEAEPLSVPAGLLGVDPGIARTALEQAREQFRTGCARAHRELAPTRECRYYNRLLDVPMRRGGALLPDVQRHLMTCRYCRYAAEQLSHFEGGLEDLLAETVLGWGARRYLASRPGRAGSPDAVPAGGRHRLRAARAARPLPEGGHAAPPGRHTKALAVAVGVTSLVLLATLFAARGWSDEGTTAAPQAGWGLVSGDSVDPDPARPSPTGPDAPGPSPRTPGIPGQPPAGPDTDDTGSAADTGPATVPSAASVDRPAEVARGRLRNLDRDLCLDVRDGRLRAGSRIVLNDCSTGSSQWAYLDDGTLRLAADPALCLGSGPDDGSVLLAGCLAQGAVVRYDLTVRGAVLPRGGKGQAVVPGKGRAVTVGGRDGSDAQRWTLEPAVPYGDPSGDSGGERTGEAPRERPDGQRERPYGDAPSVPRPGPSQTSSGEPAQERYETRFAQVDCCEDARPSAPAGDTGGQSGTEAQPEGDARSGTEAQPDSEAEPGTGDEPGTGARPGDGE